MTYNEALSEMTIKLDAMQHKLREQVARNRVLQENYNRLDLKTRPMRKENAQLRKAVYELESELRWHREYSAKANGEIADLKRMLLIQTEGGKANGLQENPDRAASSA